LINKFIWYIFLSIQLIIALFDKNYNIFFNYAQISLTLFGFTLLGTFFQNRELSKNGLNKEEKKTITKLVKINLNFLLTTVCFLVIYSASDVMFFEIEQEYARILISLIYFVLYLGGIVGLSFGTYSLYQFLKNWYKELV